MNHPFSGLTKLTNQQLTIVNGAAVGNVNLVIAEPPHPHEPKKPVIKPPIATTMAIGEEGGFNYNLM